MCYLKKISFKVTKPSLLGGTRGAGYSHWKPRFQATRYLVIREVLLKTNYEIASDQKIYEISKILREVVIAKVPCDIYKLHIHCPHSFPLCIGHD